MKGGPGLQSGGKFRSGAVTGWTFNRQDLVLGSQAVMRIQGIFVWIRIRTGCGSGSFYFHRWPPRDANKKLILKNFFCILLFEGTFTSFFNEKSQKRIVALFAFGRNLNFTL